MADAIKFQLNLGNGALNLAYNEVKATMTGSQNFINNINSYDYSVLIITNSQCITSFIRFRDTISIPSIIYGITASSNGLSTLTMANYVRYSTSSGYQYSIDLLNDSLLILAK